MSDLGNSLVSCVKKIFLPEMTKLRARFLRNVEVIVDDEPHSGTTRDWQDFLSHAFDLLRRGILGPQLDQIRTALAKLLRHRFRRPTTQVSRVHERVKLTFRERFHATTAIILFANEHKRPHAHRAKGLRLAVI